MCSSRIAGVVAVLLLSSTPTWASEWANAMFASRTHDFGTVARAAKTEHVFEFTNPFDQELHVSSVRASCGCTTPIIVTRTVAPGEVGQIRAQFNTRSFVGKRGATLTVVFDNPRYGEAQLRVDGYVRKDVVCHPGQVDLGTVQAGQPIEKVVDIQYAGQSNWQIVAAESNIDGLEVSVEETSRNGMRVGYLLKATFTGDQPGYVNGTIALRTNDNRRMNVPLNVSGRVVEPITVSPAAITLGDVSIESTASKKLIIKGEQPFRILAIHSAHDGIRWELSDESKKLHIVPVHFDAGTQIGPVTSLLKIETDCQASPMIEIEMDAMIVGTEDRGPQEFPAQP